MKHFEIYNKTCDEVLLIFPFRIVCLLLFCTLGACATGAGSRFPQKLALPTKQTVVVAEGDFEARSIGSYSVRVYTTENAQAGDDTTFFSAGLIRPRNGTLEKISLASLDHTGSLYLVVVIRSVGSGGYLSVDAFTITKNSITLHASASGLPPDTDPVAALRTTVLSQDRK